MFLLKIINDTSINTNLISKDQVFTYYSEDIGSNGVETTILKYVGKDNSGTVVSGTIGKEQLRNVLISTSDDVPEVAEVNTRYVFTNTEENLTIKLPAGNYLLNNQAILIIFVGSGNKNVYVKNFDSSATLVTLNKIVNKCLFIYNNTVWTIFNPYENNYTNWHEEKVVDNITAQPFRRYIVTETGKTITLPTTASTKNNFKIAVSLETQGWVKIKSNDSTITYNGTTSDTLELNSNSNTYVLIIYNSLVGANFRAINSKKSDWVINTITENTNAQVGHKYICKNGNGLVVTLPASASAGLRIGVFVENKLSANKYVQIKSTSNIVVGGTTTEDKSIELPSQLIYVELSYFDSAWHVIEMSMPNTSKTIQPDGITIVENPSNTFTVNNISSRLSGTNISIIPNTSTGVTTLSGIKLTQGQYISINNDVINCTLAGHYETSPLTGTTRINNGIIEVYSIISRLSGNSARTGIVYGQETDGLTSIKLVTTEAGASNINNTLHYSETNGVYWGPDTSNTYTGTNGVAVDPSSKQITLIPLPSDYATNTYVLACVRGTFTWIKQN